MNRKNLAGPINFEGVEDRWVPLGKWEYTEYYGQLDSEMHSNYLRAQWMYPGGLIATLDYYVRKNDVYGGEDSSQADVGQWEVTERVHFYEPAEGWHQLTEKFFQHDVYLATEENLEKAKARCFVLLNRRDSFHLSTWWGEWREEL